MIKIVPLYPASKSCIFQRKGFKEIDLKIHRFASRWLKVLLDVTITAYCCPSLCEGGKRLEASASPQSLDGAERHRCCRAAGSSAGWRAASSESIAAGLSRFRYACQHPSPDLPLSR